MHRKVQRQGRKGPPRKKKQRAAIVRAARRGPALREYAGHAPVADSHLAEITQVFVITVKSSTATYAGTSIYSNSLYSFDGSTPRNAPGSKQLTTLWSMNRVLRYKYKVTSIDTDSFPESAIILNSNIQPTGTPGDDWQDRAGQNFSQRALLSGSSGMNKHVFHFSASICEIVGSAAPKYDDSYRAVAGTDPSDVTWINFGVDSNGGSNIVNGTQFMIELTQLVLFYSVRPDAPLSSHVQGTIPVPPKH